MRLKEFDTILLKDGRQGDVMDISPGAIAIDIGSGPADWETIYVTRDDIERILETNEED